MPKLHDVIYIPGIGDTKTTFQELAVKTWQLYGVVPHTCPMRWATREPFEDKFARLLQLIDAKLADNHRVSLVGASAGATVVINAMAVRPAVRGAVLIAGKVNRPETIGSWYDKHASAFVESASLCQESLAQLGVNIRASVLSVYGKVDPIVPKRDSIIDGAQQRQALTVGHAVTIATQLVFGARKNMKFLKEVAGS